MIDFKNLSIFSFFVATSVVIGIIFINIHLGLSGDYATSSSLWYEFILYAVSVYFILVIFYGLLNKKSTLKETFSQSLLPLIILLTLAIIGLVYLGSVIRFN